ncbi:hypothetical protein BGY98DRAFT_1146060 [Russula aff. rugulosa BPL654]|nr:hypothetical protein BGY98DRAFT_1146060 [Russula aff. rugulosa BPL654]
MAVGQSESQSSKGPRTWKTRTVTRTQVLIQTRTKYSSSDSDSDSKESLDSSSQSKASANAWLAANPQYTSRAAAPTKQHDPPPHTTSFSVEVLPDSAAFTVTLGHQFPSPLGGKYCTPLERPAMTTPYHLRSVISYHPAHGSTPPPSIASILGCGKTFARLYSPRAHTTRVHAAERPFRCTRCPTAFASNYDSKRPEGLREDKAWRCTGCAKTFSFPVLSRNIGWRRRRAIVRARRQTWRRLIIDVPENGADASAATSPTVMRPAALTRTPTPITTTSHTATRPLALQ